MERRTAVISSLAVASLAVALAGCDVTPSNFSGGVITENRATTSFDAVEIRGAANVTIVAGEDYAITVTAGDRTIGDVNTSVIGTTLVIDENRVTSAGKVDITLHAPTIRSVQILGAGNIDITGIDTDEFALVVAGAGDITAAGRADSVVALIAGTGKIDTFGLAARDATVRLNGVGEIRVAASGTLDAELNGVGEIVYSGDPVVTSKLAGVGNIGKA